MRRWLTVIAISAGVVLRLLGYFRNRSLWFDEAALASNIVERPLSGLFRPLEFHQGAPVGFLVAEKIVSSLFGPSEFVLRLLPLVCGLLIVFLAGHAALLYIDRSAVLLAVALVAVNPSLIYYSSEVKQYSSDALTTLLLLWMFVRLAQSELSAKKIFVFGFMGAAAIWFSHPAAFLLASAAIVLLVSTRTQKTGLFG
jgi:predicted membrane-bound mannosyltransferase